MKVYFASGSFHLVIGNTEINTLIGLTTDAMSIRRILTVLANQEIKGGNESIGDFILMEINDIEWQICYEQKKLFKK